MEVIATSYYVDWWGYVKSVIRKYPALKEQYAETHRQGTTAKYGDGMPHGGGDINRTVEDLSVRELPGIHQREYEAVRRAIEITSKYRNGRERLKIIDAVFWRRSHTLTGAAFLIPCSNPTARAWHGEFIRLVAAQLGFMDEE